MFLIGGQTRDSEPVPILLRSGDIVIMSGPACRRAYHGELLNAAVGVNILIFEISTSGVPRILEGTTPPHLLKEALPENERDFWIPYEDYMRTTRINVNVRQVFPKGFDPGVVLSN